MSDTLASEPHDDPAGIQSAIDRHRDIAKYLVGVFAAIGALLLAGTQLSSIGQLDVSDDAGRLVAAGIALAVGLAMVIAIMAFAVFVLQPVEMSLDQVIDDPDLAREIDRRPTLLGGASSVQALTLVDARDLDPDAREDWEAVIATVVDRAAFRTSQRRFKRASAGMIVCAAIAAAAIAVFAYAANPPAEEQGAEMPVPPAPEAVRVTLTAEGRHALADVLGARCVAAPIDALAIGGAPEAPRVVVLPQDGCEPAQLELAPAIGIATASHADSEAATE